MLFEVVTPTADGIFTAAGSTMTGLVTMTGNFFTSLWNNPMGQIICTLGIVSGAIGLCYRLFLHRKHV